MYTLKKGVTWNLGKFVFFRLGYGYAQSAKGSIQSRSQPVWGVITPSTSQYGF